VQRLRIRYAKRGRLRFTSHRDFQRAFERALRRATKAIENGDQVAVTRNLKVVRRQMSSAWRGAS